MPRWGGGLRLAGRKDEGVKGKTSGSRRGRSVANNICKGGEEGMVVDAKGRKLLQNNICNERNICRRRAEARGRRHRGGFDDGLSRRRAGICS